MKIMENLNLHQLLVLVEVDMVQICLIVGAQGRPRSQILVVNLVCLEVDRSRWASLWGPRGSARSQILYMNF